MIILSRRLARRLAVPLVPLVFCNVATADKPGARSMPKVLPSATGFAETKDYSGSIGEDQNAGYDWDLPDPDDTPDGPGGAAILDNSRTLRDGSGGTTGEIRRYPTPPPLKVRPARIFDWKSMRHRELSQDEQYARHKAAMIEYWEEGMKHSAAMLDVLEMRMVDYGTITMSAPLLSQPGDAFAFDLNKSADDYFDYARTDVHALAQNREATVQSTQISGSVAQDIVAEGRLERQLRTEQQADLDAVENRLIEEQAVSIKRAAIEQTYQAELAAADADTTLDASGKEIAKANAATKKATALLELRREIPDAGTGGVLPDRDDTGAGEDLLKTPRETLGKLAEKGPLDVLPQIAPTMSSRSAIITAAGDNAVESIFKLLGNPQKYIDYQDKVLLFGVVAVSVTPGKETVQNYAADITVALNYDWQRAKASTLWRLSKAKENSELSGVLANLARKEESLKDESDLDERRKERRPPPRRGVNPLVVAVSPLMEQQVIDQSSSFRKQTEFALQLSGLLGQAGLTAQADAIQQYIKRQEAEARSRDPIGLVNSYSLAGGTFGFRVSPRFQALGDPTSRKAKSARILGPQSFPALVIIAIDAQDYQPLVERNGEAITKVWEPCFKFVQTSRWIPLSGNTRGIVSACGRGAFLTEKDRQKELMMGLDFDADRLAYNLKYYFMPRSSGITSKSAKGGLPENNGPSWTTAQLSDLKDNYSYLIRASSQLQARWDAVNAHTTDLLTGISIPSEVLVPSSRLVRDPVVEHVRVNKPFIFEGAGKAMTREVILIGNGFDNLDADDPVILRGGDHLEVLATVKRRMDNRLELEVSAVPSADFAVPGVIGIHLKYPDDYREGGYSAVGEYLEVVAKQGAAPNRYPMIKGVFAPPVQLVPTADGKGWAEPRIEFAIVGTDLDTIGRITLLNKDTGPIEVEKFRTEGGNAIFNPADFKWPAPPADFPVPNQFIIQIALKKEVTGTKEEVVLAMPGSIPVVALNGTPGKARKSNIGPLRFITDPIKGLLKPDPEDGE